MIEWEEYRKQLQTRIADFARLSPGTMRGYRELSTAGTKSDVLGAKVRELIALAVAVTRQCDGCITIHTTAAIEQGATREEIVEALGVAIAVNAGAALVYSARVLDAYEARQSEIPEPDRPTRAEQNMVDRAGRDSFPASDPPPWTPPGRY